MLFLTIYVSEVLGLGKTFASYCIGAFGMGAVVSSFVGGHLADQFGRRMTMLIALFGGAAVLILQSRITNGWIFMAGMFMFAMILDMYRPATSAMISDLTKPDERPHAFGLMYIAMNLGFAIAPPIGGFLAEKSFQWLFWGDAVTTALYGVVILLFVSETKPRVDGRGRFPELPSMESPANPYEPPLAELAAIDEAERTGTTLTVSNEAAASAKIDIEQVTFRGGLARMRKDGIFIMYCVCSLLTSIVFMQAFVTLPLYLLAKGFSKSEFGSMICVNGIVIVLFQLPLTHFLRRYSRTKIVLFGELLLATGFGLTVFADSAAFIVFTIAIWTFGEIFQAPYKSAIVAEMAPVELRARYMGMFNLSHSLSLMLGAPLGGFILDRFGPGVLWPGCSVLLTGTTLCYAWILKRHAESNRRN
jgi:MFS family permease